MKRHRFDPFAFLFGAFFLTVGLTVALGTSAVDVVGVFRSWPTAIIVTGFVLVAWALSRVLRPASDGAAGDPPPGETGPEESAMSTAELMGAADTAELDEGGPPAPTP